MRMLTFRSFLRRTLQQLSQNSSSAPLQLAKELPEDPRLLEPLGLYAACALEPARRAHLLRACPALAAEFAARPFLQGPAQELPLRLEELEPTDPYYKVWRSYCSVRDRCKADNHAKALMNQKIRRLQQQKGITNYRLYTDLHLNPGNLNAYLKHNDCSKVSLTTARRALRYLQQLE